MTEPLAHFMDLISEVCLGCGMSKREIVDFEIKRCTTPITSYDSELARRRLFFCTPQGHA